MVATNGCGSADPCRALNTPSIAPDRRKPAPPWSSSASPSLTRAIPNLTTSHESVIGAHKMPQPGIPSWTGLASTAEQPLARSEDHRSRRDDQLVDLPRRQRLPDDVGAAADGDVA